MNDLFGGDELTDADRVNYVRYLADKMLEVDMLAQQSTANPKAQFGDSPDFMHAFDDVVTSAYESHKSMSEQVMTKPHVRKALAALLLDIVYSGFAERRGGDTSA